jgi:hypothetical protein
MVEPAVWSRAACSAAMNRKRNIARHRAETAALYRRGEIGDSSMLTFQLVGAAFLLLCLAPLLARDPNVRRSSR